VGEDYLFEEKEQREFREIGLQFKIIIIIIIIIILKRK
jgi:hypothetical protein